MDIHHINVTNPHVLKWYANAIFAWHPLVRQQLATTNEMRALASICL